MLQVSRLMPALSALVQLQGRFTWAAPHCIWTCNLAGKQVTAQWCSALCRALLRPSAVQQASLHASHCASNQPRSDCLQTVHRHTTQAAQLTPAADRCPACQCLQPGLHRNLHPATTAAQAAAATPTTPGGTTILGARHEAAALVEATVAAGVEAGAGSSRSSSGSRAPGSAAAAATGTSAAALEVGAAAATLEVGATVEAPTGARTPLRATLAAAASGATAQGSQCRTSPPALAAGRARAEPSLRQGPKRAEECLLHSAGTLCRHGAPAAPSPPGKTSQL